MNDRSGLANHRNRSQMYFLCPNERVMEIIKISKLDTIFEIRSGSEGELIRTKLEKPEFQRWCDSDEKPNETTSANATHAQRREAFGLNNTDDGARQELKTQTGERWIDLPAFWIDATEVSNAEYRSFVEATGHPPPAHWGDDYDPALDALPVVGVTQRDAQVYARWRGKRLPTVFEWECAARGPDGRRLSWGDEAVDPDPSDDVIRRGRALDVAGLLRAYLADVRPVDSHPELRTPQGLFHMWGNVREFTDSVLFAEGNSRIVKGAAWDMSPANWDLTRTGTRPGGKHSYKVGFRCAKSAAPDGNFPGTIERSNPCLSFVRSRSSRSHSAARAPKSTPPSGNGGRRSGRSSHGTSRSSGPGSSV